jgi:hypothetical protein
MKQPHDKFKVLKSVMMAKGKSALTNRNKDGIRATVVNHAFR